MARVSRERVSSVVSALPIAIIVLSLAALIAPGFARAQTSGDGSIVGEVSDSSGAVLPGATVEATSPVLLGQVRSTVTDSQGRYTLIALRPGTYALKISAPGFSTLNRTGLELTSNFTATINVSLTVGAVQQEVTVTTAAPMVDTQTLTQQTTITRQLLTTIPTAQSALGIASLMPAAVEPPNAQDVGGTKGETSVRISIHGTKSFDSRLRQEGMIYSALTPGGNFGQSGLEGTGRGYYIDPIAVSEVVVDTGSMGSAEYGVGGAQSNAIYKDGGDQFHGAVSGAWTNHMLQASNLTQSLINQGFIHPNGTRYVYDGDAEIGGPIKKGKAWWLLHARGWGSSLRTPLFPDANLPLRQAGTLGVAGLPAGITAADWKYAPNLAKAVNQKERDKAVGGRVAFAVTPKDKLTFSYDKQLNFQDSLSGALLQGTTKVEGNGAYCQNETVVQVTWTRVQSSKLLFQGGVSRVNFDFNNWATNLALNPYTQCGAASYNNVVINDVGLGYIYNGAGSKAESLSHQTNGRFLTDVVKGSHDFKFGTQWMWGLGGGYRSASVRTPSQVGGLPVSYTFSNGNPISLTQFVTPLYTTVQLNPDLGIFGQDQWRVTRKLTVSYGIRFDWVRENDPAINEPASTFTGIPARTLPALYNVPNWKDLNPRFGVVWDPTGSGKTAIKAGINRYVDGETTGIGNDLSPATATVSSTTRSWTDGNHNFLPDCDLSNNALQDHLATGGDKCGAVANAAFGTTVSTIHADPNWIQGWGKRPYGWQVAVSAQRQIVPSVSVSAGYYRSWYGNQVAVNNTLVTPADFDPYCLPVPNDPRFPSYIAGTTLCGLYDINPAIQLNGKSIYGQVNNIATFARNFGHQTDIYNGADVLFQVQHRGLLIAGGFNIGNSLQTGTTAGGVVSASTSQCFTVWNPEQSSFIVPNAGASGTLVKCVANPPYQSRFRANGSYNFPHGIVFAAVFQSNPGPVYQTNISYSAATIQAALPVGHTYSSGAAQTVEVDNPYSQFGPRLSQLDIRGTKNFAVWGERKLQLNFDLYNVFNSSAVESIFSSYGTYGSVTAGATYAQPQQIMDARLFKFSFLFNF